MTHECDAVYITGDIAVLLNKTDLAGVSIPHRNIGKQGVLIQYKGENMPIVWECGIANIADRYSSLVTSAVNETEKNGNHITFTTVNSKYSFELIRPATEEEIDTALYAYLYAEDPSSTKIHFSN